MMGKLSRKFFRWARGSDWFTLWDVYYRVGPYCDGKWRNWTVPSFWLANLVSSWFNRRWNKLSERPESFGKGGECGMSRVWPKI